MKNALIFLSVVFLLVNSDISYADSTWVSGTISGQTWTAANSPYCVNGNITVNSLVIEPAVEVHFFGNYDFRITGSLTAVGTKEDSIIFTKAASNVARWAGIWLDHVPEGTELAFCRIDSGNHGLYSDNSTDVVVRNTTIKNNYLMGTGVRGCGVYVLGNLTLTECQIVGNTTYGYAYNGAATSFAEGGGFYVDSGGNLTLNNCSLRNNHCIAYNYNGMVSVSALAYGGGIHFASNGILQLNNTVIDSNSSTVTSGNNRYTRGGGLYLNGGISTLNNSIISNNSVSGGSNEAGGIYKLSSGSSLTLNNSTVAYNTSDGIRNTAGTLTASNSILYLNMPTQISGSAIVTYSDVQGGWSGEGNIDIYPEFFGPDSLHIEFDSPCVDVGNPNAIYNDPVDPSSPGNTVWPAWGAVRNDMGAHGGPGAAGWWVGAEISVTPEILDFGSCELGSTVALPLDISNTGITNLILFNVLCSNACFSTNFNPPANLIAPGNTLSLTVTFAPEDTLSYVDTLFMVNSYELCGVGLLGQGAAVGIANPNPGTGIPKEFALRGPYPNPFNPATTLKMELPVASWVKLEIYDVGGKSVGTIIEGWRRAGYHEVNFDGSDLSSGLYFAKLMAADCRQVKKMVLLK
jgi:hypothetical protein